MAKNSQMLSWRSHMINFQTAGKVSEVPVTSSTPTVYVPPDTLPWFQFKKKKKKNSVTETCESYAQWENWYTNIVLTHVLNYRDVNNMHHGWPLPCLCTALSSALNVLFS